MASRCAILVVSKHKLKERASMEEVSIIGVDLAKNLFQLHGAAADGAVVFRKKLSRPQFGRFMAERLAPARTIGRGRWRGMGMRSG
jgi:transposase